tara:strand:+ start:1648 stop:2211 length:564 start_codon:yes stop_codon:yes gene_type:complete
MVKEIIKRICVVISYSILVFSCVEDIDFEQTKDFEATPVLESSLIFFDEPANRFLDSGNEITVIQDSVLVNFFNDKFIIDNLVKAEFQFEIINTINRAFELQVDLFDDNQLQHTFTIFQEASSNNNENFTIYIETFEDNTLQALKRTNLLVFTLRLLPGESVDQNTIGRIQLKSLAVFYFNIRDDIE